MKLVRGEACRLLEDDGMPREAHSLNRLAPRFTAAVMMKPVAFAARARAAEGPTVSDGIGRRRNLVPTSAAVGPRWLRSTTIQTWED